MQKCLISACLVGLCTRYDGQSKLSSRCRAHLHNTCWIPVCPEQLGGLPTPRTAADLVDGDGHAVLAGKARVVDRLGLDVTRHFIQGARQVLAIARAQQIELALLKNGSPSCGLTPRIGVTAALLQRENIQVRSF